MGVILGVDFGQKRIGLALSDETGLIASAFKTVYFEGRNQLLRELEPIIKEYRIETVVAGLPVTLKGSEEIAAEKVKAHVAWFEGRLPVRWVLWDERLTTAEVDRIFRDAGVGPAKRREVRDQLAAQRILQSYLDSKRTHSTEN